MLGPTGFCYNCGRLIAKGLFCVDANNKPKCEIRYKMKQERLIKRGKKAGYGLSGSTH